MEWVQRARGMPWERNGVGAMCHGNEGECRGMQGECKGAGAMCQGNAGECQGNVLEWVQSAK